MADLTALSGPAEMLAAMPGQFVGRANLTRLWNAVGAPVSDLEAVIVWLQTAFALDTATGVQMDAMGERVNQPRAGGAYPVGESDTDYRGKLRAAILRNRSMGTAENMRGMVKALLTGKSPVVQIVDVPPAGFVLAVWVSSALTTADADALVAFCVAAKSAGVGIAGLAWYTAPTFAFDGYPDPPFRGYGDGSGNGGYWANYIYP